MPAGLLPAWTLNNHDVQRAVTRFGRADAATHGADIEDVLDHSHGTVDIDVGTRRARAAALFAARVARLRVPVRRRGARSAGGARPARRGPSGPDLRPHGRRRDRSRRVPRAAAVDRRRRHVVRLLAARDRRIRGSRNRRSGRAGTWRASKPIRARCSRSIDARSPFAGRRRTSRPPASSCCSPTTPTSWCTAAATSSSSSTCPTTSATCRPTSSPGCACSCRPSPMMPAPFDAARIGHPRRA